MMVSALVAQHRTAVQAELIDRGLRLRDLGEDHFLFSDLWSIIDNLGQDPSPLNRSIYGDEIQTLTYEMQLLHSIEYQLRIANYRETKDGQKNRNPPYPLELPGYGPYGDKNVREVDSVPHEEIENLFFKDYDESQFV